MRTVDLGVDARRPLTARQITMIAGWRDRGEEATTATCRREAVRLARRVRTLDEDFARSRADITELTAQDTPQLLELSVVVHAGAASVLIVWSYRASALRGLAGRELSDPSLVGQHRAASTQPRR